MTLHLKVDVTVVSTSRFLQAEILVLEGAPPQEDDSDIVTFEVSHPSSVITNLIPPCVPQAQAQNNGTLRPTPGNYDTVRATINTSSELGELDLLVRLIFIAENILKSPPVPPADQDLVAFFFWLAANIAHSSQNAELEAYALKRTQGKVLMQYMQRHQRVDLQELINSTRKVADLGAPGPSPCGAMADFIGLMLKHFGVDEELEEAVDWFRQYVSGVSLQDPSVLDKVAWMFSDYGGSIGRIEDLELALRVSKRALDLLPADDISARRPILWRNCQILLRYARNTHRLDLLEECIQNCRAALISRGSDEELSGILNKLSGNPVSSLPHWLTQHYRELGQDILCCLADALLLRSKYLGNQESDFEAIQLYKEAIGIYQQVLNLIPSKRIRPFIIIELLELLDKVGEDDKALMLATEELQTPVHFEYTRDLVLASADILQSAVNRNPIEEHAHRLTHIIDQLTEDILQPHTPPHARLQLSTRLAEAHSRRFEISRDPEDALAGLRYMQEVVDLVRVHPGYGNLASYLFTLAHMYKNSQSPNFNICAALDLMSEALDDMGSSPQQRLRYANEFFSYDPGSFSLDPQTESEAFTGYANVMKKMVHLLPQVADLGLDLEGRLRALSRFGEHMVVYAASILAYLQRFQESVEVLEAGRGVFWSQALKLRTPLDDLPQEIGDKLKGLSRQLEEGSFTGRGSRLCLRSEAELEIDAARRRRLGEEFQRTADEVRKIPGYEHFLQPSLPKKVKGDKNGGLFVFLVSENTLFSYALIFRPDDPEQDGNGHNYTCIPITLDITYDVLQKCNASLKGAYQKSRQSKDDPSLDLDEDDLNEDSENAPNGAHRADRAGRIGGGGNKMYLILRLLWEKVVQPVIRALFIKPSSGKERPRLWWCPTGVFTFLPVHAAGIYTEGGQCCSDYVVSSYTPTWDALLSARSSFRPIPRGECKILLAAVPAPHEGLPLNGTRLEMEEITHIVPALGRLSIPLEEDVLHHSKNGVYAKTVLEKLPEASILHLACHGKQDHNSPLNSGFIMRDETLTISKILPLNLQHAFLAFLSACETAQGDANNPNQTIHLAAAMMFTGFKSIVATMWSMSDEDGPLVSRTVYEELYKGVEPFLDPETVPYALDDAVRKLRARGLTPERWAPYIHIGI